MAILLAAFTLYGVHPGPQLFTRDPLLVWTIIASMYLGNVVCLILNLPLVGLWARMALIPYRFLAPVILSVCVIGAYSPRSSMFDVWVALCFGLLGYFMKIRQWPTAPLILGFLLGPNLEIAFRQSIGIGQAVGNLAAPFLGTIPMAFFILAVLFIAVSIYFRRKVVPKEIWEEGAET
jgi:putative tricarboxylic transport membrane protein